MQPDHFDLALRHWLMKLEGDGSDPSYCYVLPPIGHFLSHSSGCEPGQYGVCRPANWGERWCCPGTRREQDPHQRDKCLCRLTVSGEPQYLTKFDLGNPPEQMKWLSYMRNGGEPPRPKGKWLELLGSDDERVAAAACVPAASPAAATGGRACASRQPSAASAGPPGMREPAAAGGHRGAKGDRSGAAAAVALGAGRTRRARRNDGQVTLARSFRFWAKSEAGVSCGLRRVSCAHACVPRALGHGGEGFFCCADKEKRLTRTGCWMRSCRPRT